MQTGWAIAGDGTICQSNNFGDSWFKIPSEVRRGMAAGTNVRSGPQQEMTQHARRDMPAVEATPNPKRVQHRRV
eukprot:5812482-Pyramimonas_sp.AAC.2